MVYLEKVDPSKKERGRGRRRRWTFLPPPGPAEELEGVQVLNELSGHPFGLVLFQRYRDVLLWNQVTPSDRKHLFQAGGDALLSPGEPLDASEALKEALDVLARMVRHRAGVGEEHVALAASQISGWAYELGFHATAAAFASLAALVRPDDPDLAFAAGRATRDAGRFHLAEVWFHRTIAVARRAKNEEAKAAGFIGWGVLEDVRGRRRAARTKFETALSTAQGGGLARMAGLAHQYLMQLTVPDGSFEEGLAHAVAAHRLFSDEDPKLIRLAVDTGAFLSEHSYFSTALLLYEAAYPFLTRQADRLAGLANIGRAAAAVGKKRRFAEVWAEFDRLALVPPKQFYCESLIELARGTVTLRYWRHGSKLVEEAADLATARGELRCLAAAQALRKAIEGKDDGDTDRSPDPPLERFASRFQERLRALAVLLIEAAPG